MLKIMTFNLRTASVDDGINNWNCGRNELVFKLIETYQPDILGVQEVCDGCFGNQLSELQQLTGYTWYGVGRDDGADCGERAGIMFRYRRFKLGECGQFWLSNTPDVPGTTFVIPQMEPSWDHRNPRMVTWCVLEDVHSGNKYFVVNQHWAVAKAVHLDSALLLQIKLAALNPNWHEIPFIVMGDFNFSDIRTVQNQSSLMSYQTILGLSSIVDNIPLVDAYRKIYHYPRPIIAGESTFHGYLGGVNYAPQDLNNELNNRIDFIFTSPQLIPHAAQIIRDSFTTFKGRWPSDHYPLMVMID